MPLVKSPQSAPEFTDGITLVKGSDILWIIGLLIVLTLAAVFSLLFVDFVMEEAGFQSLFDGQQRENWSAVVVLGIIEIGFLAVVHALFVMHRAMSWRELGFARCKPQMIAAALLLVAVFWVIEASMHSGLAEAYAIEPLSTNPTSLVASILVFGLLSGGTSEILFRGLLHRWLRQRLTLVAGTFVSATISALAGFFFIEPGGDIGIQATAWTWLLAVIAALLYEKSGSLWPPIVLSVGTNISVISVAATRLAV